MSRYKLVARDYFGEFISGPYKLVLVPGWEFKLLRYRALMQVLRLLTEWRCPNQDTRSWSLRNLFVADVRNSCGSKGYGSFNQLLEAWIGINSTSIIGEIRHPRISLKQAPFQKGDSGWWWAGPDLNRRPSARQADVLTRLDDRPVPTLWFEVFP